MIRDCTSTRSGRPPADASVWDEHADRYRAQERFERRAVAAMLRLARPRAEDVVVDLATGTGVIPRALANESSCPASLTAVDRSAGMVARVGPLRDGWSTLLADARSVPLADASVDLVIVLVPPSPTAGGRASRRVARGASSPASERSIATGRRDGVGQLTAPGGTRGRSRADDGGAPLSHPVGRTTPAGSDCGPAACRVSLSSPRRVAPRRLSLTGHRSTTPSRRDECTGCGPWCVVGVEAPTRLARGAPARAVASAPAALPSGSRVWRSGGAGARRRPGRALRRTWGRRARWSRACRSCRRP